MTERTDTSSNGSPINGTTHDRGIDLSEVVDLNRARESGVFFIDDLAETGRVNLSEVVGLDDVLAPDGTPLVDVPAVTVARASRHADELAALVESTLEMSRLAVAALERVGDRDPLMDSFDPETRESVAMAKAIVQRSAKSLRIVRDGLGQQHVELDELAEDLDRTGRETTRAWKQGYAA